jgi:hypothetical protein
MVDFRNLFTLGDVKGTGLTYHSIGRASIKPDSDQPSSVVPLKSGAV